MTLDTFYMIEDALKEKMKDELVRVDSYFRIKISAGIVEIEEIMEPGDAFFELQALQKQTEQLREDYDDLQEQLGTIEDENAALESRIFSLNNDLVNEKNKNTQLKSHLNEIRKALIGCSYNLSLSGSNTKREVKEALDAIIATIRS